MSENPVEKTYEPIICYKCKRDTGYTEEVILAGELKEDLKCPYCGTVVVSAEVDYC